VSFSTFWHAKVGLQMYVLGRAMKKIFGSQFRGDRPPRPSRASATGRYAPVHYFRSFYEAWSVPRWH